MKYALLLFCLLTAASLCQAQPGTQNTRPDFSGTWVLDMGMSELGRSKPNYDGVKLMIIQTTNSLDVTRILSIKKKDVSQSLVYYFDGRGEANPEMADKGVVKSKTSWDGDTLVLQCLHSTPVAIGTVTVESNDKWTISADGKSLTWISMLSAPHLISGYPTFSSVGPSSIKRVFSKTF